jgi:hypothetical protein
MLEVLMEGLEGPEAFEKMKMSGEIRRCSKQHLASFGLAYEQMVVAAHK